MTELQQGMALGVLFYAVGKKDRETRAQVEASLDAFSGNVHRLVQAVATKDRDAIARWVHWLGLKPKDGQLLYQAVIDLAREQAERTRNRVFVERVRAAQAMMSAQEFAEWLVRENETFREQWNVVAKLPEKESA